MKTKIHKNTKLTLVNVGKRQILLCFLLVHTFFVSSQVYSWAKTLQGADPDCRIYSSDTDREGNTYVTGVLKDTLDFDPTSSTSHLYGYGKPTIFLAKYSSNGSLVWAQSFGSAYNDNGGGIGYSVKADTFGNIYIAGLFKGGVDFNYTVAELTLSHSGTFNNIFLAKYTNSGDFIWASNAASIRSTDNGAIRNVNVRIDHHGYPFVVASFTGTLYLSGGQQPAPGTTTNVAGTFFSKYTPWGPNYMWSRVIPSTGDMFVKDIQMDTTGNMYITGDFMGSVNFDPGASDRTLSSIFSSQDFFLAKYNRNGSYIWANSFGGQSSDEVCGLGLDASNNIYITGSVDGTIDIDPGAATVTLNTGTRSSYLAKFDNNGNYSWAKAIEGLNSTNYGKALKVDNSGNVLTAGFFKNITDFDPGAGDYNLTSQGNFDLYFAKYNSSGDLIGAADLGGSGALPDMNQSTTNLSLDDAENIYLTGAFMGTIDFDPGSGTANLSSATNTMNTIFMARYSGSSLLTGIRDHNKLASVYNFYPNPSTQKAFLSLELKESSFTRISIFNVSGALVQTLENQKLEQANYKYEIYLKESGVYFLRIEVNGITETKKIIVAN